MMGQTLGHYKILDKLGAGGMGEVYLAEDVILKRQVALKVLPPDLAASQERLERFQREAEALAALNHPNIVTVFSVEEEEGTRFLTMELVEGKPLSQLIPKGGLSLQRIFEIAIPLADALATAHERGVIHRDLKPANIMLSEDGRVKVLDFGLAKLRQEETPQNFTELPTEPLTAEGRILGTMPYMSPEQLEGVAAVDARSDIFSLGVVLYEMATGVRPFRGDTSVSLISSIIKENPRDVRECRGDLPNHLARIVNRCLNKKPDRRFQSAKDVWNDLLDLQQETTSGEAAPTRTRKTRRTSWVTLAIAGALALAVIFVWYLWSSRPVDLHTVPSYREVRLTANPESLRARGVISPDGRLLAFRDPYGVYVQDIDLGEIKSVLGEGAYWDLGWHPDGRRLLVGESAGPDQQDIWLVSLLTSEKELLQENAFWGEISPDGRWLAFVRYDAGDLWIRSLPDGKPRVLVQGHNNQVGFSSWSPSGRRLALIQIDYSGSPPDAVLITVDIEEGTTRELLREPRLVFSMGALGGTFWQATGRLFYVLANETSTDSGSSLWSMPIDEEDGTQLGSAEMVKTWSGAGLMDISGSVDGTRIAFTRIEENLDVYVGELNPTGETGGELRRITDHRGIDLPVGWQSDDELLIYSDRHRRAQLLSQPLNGDPPEIALNLPSDDAEPLILGTGGEWVLALEPLGSDTDSSEGMRLRRLSLDGRTSESLYELRKSNEGTSFYGLQCPSVSDRPCILSEGVGQTLIFSEFDPFEGKGAKLSALELTEAVQLRGWGLSPTGTRLAMPADSNTLMILDLENLSQAKIPLEAISLIQYLVWSKDEESIIVSAIREGHPERFVVARVGLDGSYEDLWTSHSTWLFVAATSPDGQRVALGGNQIRSDVWMLCTDCPGDSPLSD